MNMNIMQLLQHNHKTHRILLLIILVLSAYVHLWNPVGFPDINFDEGIYMRRAMNILETGNPQESYFYDHPYFGQIILAGVLKIAGFPQSVEQSLELSYLIPRLFIGLVAVLDTFLVFKIAEKKFNNKVALLAAILFADEFVSIFAHGSPDIISCGGYIRSRFIIPFPTFMADM